MKKRWEEWGPIPLRVIFGGAFVYHGFPKLFTGPGHEQFLGMLQQIGMPAPGLMSWVGGLVEFGGGIALLVGAFVRIAAALGIVQMLVAAFTVHLPHGFHFVNVTGMTEGGPQFGMPGMETPLLFAAAFLALLIGGPGPYSVDRMREERRSQPAAGPGGGGAPPGG